MRQRSHTFYVSIIITLVLIGGTFRTGRWSSNDVFVSDVAGYYMYLPSAFLTHDLGNGAWVLEAIKNYKMDHSGYMMPLPNGKSVSRYTMGMAVAYSPFFFLARTLYAIQGKTTTGFETLYEEIVTWGCVGYVLVGLWVLGRELRRYFSDRATAIALLIVMLGTNLFTYTSNETLMAHGTLFMLNVLLLRYTRRWYSDGSRWQDALWLGGISGLMILIRPSELMLLAIPLLWGVTSRTAVAGRLQFWQQHWREVLLIGLLVIIIAGQQLVFWRLIGGSWVVTFYKGETFYFNDPHLIDGLFSFRKGWLVYCPLMAFSLLGIFWVRRWAPATLPLLVLFVPIYFYVTFCWWNWEYGGSYGGRALISLYPLLAFSLAAFWQRWLQPARWALGPVLILLMVLSLIQNYQYVRGLLSCCDMSYEKYKERFLLLEWPHQ